MEGGIKYKELFSGQDYFKDEIHHMLFFKLATIFICQCYTFRIYKLLKSLEIIYCTWVNTLLKSWKKLQVFKSPFPFRNSQNQTHLLMQQEWTLCLRNVFPSFILPASTKSRFFLSFILCIWYIYWGCEKSSWAKPQNVEKPSKNG